MRGSRIKFPSFRKISGVTHFKQLIPELCHGCKLAGSVDWFRIRYVHLANKAAERFEESSTKRKEKGYLRNNNTQQAD